MNLLDFTFRTGTIFLPFSVTKEISLLTKYIVFETLGFRRRRQAHQIAVYLSLNLREIHAFCLKEYNITQWHLNSKVMSTRTVAKTSTENCRNDQLLYIVALDEYTGCPTRYRTRHFFNNFTTNNDNATRFEADLPHCVRNVTEKNVLLFKFLCNIFIRVRIIKEMPGSLASGILCI
jgi:hypothetical protein